VAKLYFRYGAMNSGKSTGLLQTAYNYEERDQRVLLLKAGGDATRAGAVGSVRPPPGLPLQPDTGGVPGAGVGG